jgi:C4-dicarboxylate-specific signal transduction histidine kinase
MTQGDCLTPMVRDAPGAAPGAAAGARALDAHRAVRYDGLLQLIDEVQRRRSIEDVARVVAARWKHCASVNHWRLLCVYAGHCALLEAEGNQARVRELKLDALDAFDADTWSRRMPHHWQGDALVAERANLPPELADARGVALSILPVQQGTATIGIVSVLSFEKSFDNQDRKFNALVAGAMATRILAILTEQSLTTDLMRAQRQILEQRQASIMGRLVNGVAHEINTPLGVQIASCDALASMVADPASATEFAADIQDTIALIDQQARRAAKIVKRLKQISAAALASPKVATPLPDELTLIAEAQADLDIRTECAPHLTLTLDRTALHTVLGELLDYARAHGGCADGAQPLVIAARDHPHCVSLQVIDHGPGFSAEQAEHFFDPFFTSKQNQGHIGIGGYIAQNVARDALGATLELQSAPGQTTVALHFAKLPTV